MRSTLINFLSGLIVLAAIFAAGKANADLVSRWKLDETSGTTAYDLAGTSNGTLNGNPIWTTGQINGALQFDGNGDYINVPDSLLLQFSQSGNFTISCWVKPAVAGYLVCKMRASGIGVFGYQLRWDSSLARFIFTTESSGNGSTSVYSANNSAPAGVWSHVVAVYSNKSMKVYVNGQLSSSGTFAYNTGTTAPTKALAIGARSYDSTVTSYFTGIIDDVHIYNTALSDQEIVQLYQGQLDKKAFKPSPANNVTNVARNAVLGWSPGTSITSHKVYFGTDLTTITNSTTPNAIVDVNNYNPGALAIGQTYYWRIDEFDGASTFKGDVWNFTVISGKAGIPSPVNGALKVHPDTRLTWTSGLGAVSHDVYLGTNYNAVNTGTTPLATTAANSYAPHGLAAGKIYYWRIDEFDGSVRYKGDVWNFTTGTPAFPGADGPGMWTTGGRGGAVYEVTTLADYNPSYPNYESPIPGSLRAAVEASGARTVVFRISGTIQLHYKLKINNPNITIAGQTAPGDGICIARYPVVVKADHVIIRYLRFRLGDNAAEEGDPQYDGPEGDGGYDSLTIVKGHNIVIDHCSASWSIDETLSCGVSDYTVPAANHPGNVTIQWCMIAESLECSVHNSPPCHAYGSLVKEGYGNEVTYHHNLYAHHEDRSPYPGNYNPPDSDPAGLYFSFCNNVIYDWAFSHGYNNQAAWPYDSVARMNFIGNYYKRGPASSGSYAFSESLPSSRGYFSGNWMEGIGYPPDPWSLVIFSLTLQQTADFKQFSPIPVSEPVTLDDAQTAYQRVLTDVGAVLPVRDSVDQRIINDVINGTGSIIDDEDQVGGWPVLASKQAPLDSDHDGMPNDWEITRGLNPNDAADRNGDRDGDGYTNLEEYLNYLVERGSTTPDLDTDTDTDWDDLTIMVSHWLEASCDEIIPGNLNVDCTVDLRDYALFAQDWGKGVIVGNTYYVATNGNDDNPGTVDEPWQTISKASDSVIAGDCVIVRDGTYYEHLMPANSGLKKAPIRFIAEHYGQAVIDATGIRNGVWIKEKTYITIDGFRITGNNSEIVTIEGSSNGCVFKNCCVYGNGMSGLTGVAVYNTKEVTVDNCLIYGNGGNGIRSSNASDLLVTGCTIYGNGKGLNLIGNGSIKDCIIASNTIYGIQSDSNHSVSYSDIWGSGTSYYGGVIAGAGCIGADPGFINPGTDFHLSTTSPCIGTASDGGDMGYLYPAN